MLKLKSFLKEHTLIFIYFFVFAILLNGIFIYSGTKYIFELSLFFFPLLLFYFGFSFLLKKKNIDLFKPFTKLQHIPKSFDIILGIVCILLILGHLITLGGSPAIEGIGMLDTSSVAELRRSISTETTVLWGYLASFNIKAILPFCLLLFLHKKKNLLFLALYLIGSFYAFSLMQKSYILTVLLPILIYSLIHKKFFQSLLYIGTCCVVIVGLIIIANPQMRGGIDNIAEIQIEEPQVTIEVSDEDKDPPYYIRVLAGLKHRVFEVPGEMVVGWFDAIPEKKPFLYGSGYNFYAKMTGKEHRNYAKELYPVLRPRYVQKGFKGSVNTATFMYDYSNFGLPGLVLAALILALVFVVTESIFKGSFILKLSLNFFPVFMLSSGAITTALFSGGWGLIIFLFFIFSKDLNIKNENA